MNTPGAMINLLGEKGFEGNAYYEGLETFLKIKEIHPHLYGKCITKPFRKMGHITITGKNIEEVKKIAHKALNGIRVITKEV
jgi:5-(carboxyamino)imidazole ribonucleotide synthase